MKVVLTNTAKTLFKSLVIAIVVILLLSSGCVRFISWLEYKDVDKTPSVSSSFKEEDIGEINSEEEIKSYYSRLKAHESDLQKLKEQHPKNPWISSKLKKYNKHIESFLSHEFLLPTKCYKCKGTGEEEGWFRKKVCSSCGGTRKNKNLEKITGKKIVNPNSYY